MQASSASQIVRSMAPRRSGRSSSIRNSIRSSLLSRRKFSGARIKDYTPYISPISNRRQPSAIRKLMPLMDQPGMVSLGGGLPNPSLFPFTSLKFGVSDPSNGRDVELELTHEELSVALQYSPTPGVPKLRQHLRDLQSWEHGVDVAAKGHYDVSVTVGSQDGLTKAFEMLLDPNSEDELFVEDPTYSGALAFLRPFGVKLTPVATDGHGLRPDSLREALERSSGKERERRRVLYTIPNAQNPSGSTTSNDRREAVYQLTSRHDVIIIEDDPYYFLHPDRRSLKSFLSLDTDRRVLRFDSTSKLISSGMRIGFATGPPELMERLNLHTQATNLHDSGVSQLMTQKLLDHWGKAGFDRHARDVAEFYCQRRDVCLAAADRHLTGLAEWNAPEAGMFLWIKLLHGIIDTKALIEEKAAAANVLFVPGQAFDPLDSPSPYVRASFSTASDEEMDVAMQRLAALIRSEASLDAYNNEVA